MTMTNPSTTTLTRIGNAMSPHLQNDNVFDSREGHGKFVPCDLVDGDIPCDGSLLQQQPLKITVKAILFCFECLF